MPQITSAGQTTELTTKLDEASADVIYIGSAKLGTADSAASWQIRKIETAGNVTSILYADGDRRFDNIWDNRASLTYSN